MTTWRELFEEMKKASAEDRKRGYYHVRVRVYGLCGWLQLIMGNIKFYIRYYGGKLWGK